MRFQNSLPNQRGDLVTPNLKLHLYGKNFENRGDFSGDHFRTACASIDRTPIVPSGNNSTIALADEDVFLSELAFLIVETQVRTTIASPANAGREVFNMMAANNP